MKFTEKKFDQALAEIKQTLDVKFAFIRRIGVGHYTNSHPFVKCRDFLGDCLYAIEKQERQAIYGFSFDPAKQKIYKKKTMLVMQFPDRASRINFCSNIEKVNTELSKAYKENIVVHLESDDYAIIVASNFWIKTVAALSYFTFVLKCACYPCKPFQTLFQQLTNLQTTVKNWEGKDVNAPLLETKYYRDIKDTLPQFLFNLKRGTRTQGNCHGLTGFIDISFVHNAAGFYSTCKYKSTHMGMMLL